MRPRLGAHLAVAFFLPAIVYLADAVGTQTEALAIRGLSVGMGIRRRFGREALTGLFVGAVPAASTIATLIAMAAVVAATRIGRDPAFGTGSLATVMQDLLSIVIYLGTFTLLL